MFFLASATNQKFPVPFLCRYYISHLFTTTEVSVGAGAEVKQSKRHIGFFSWYAGCKLNFDCLPRRFYASVNDSSSQLFHNVFNDWSLIFANTNFPFFSLILLHEHQETLSKTFILRFVKSAVRKKHNHSLPKNLDPGIIFCGAGTCWAAETFLFWIQPNGCKVGLSTAPFFLLLYLQTLAQTLQLWRFQTFSLRPGKINRVEVHMWHPSGCFWTVNVASVSTWAEIFDFFVMINL